MKNIFNYFVTAILSLSLLVSCQNKIGWESDYLLLEINNEGYFTSFLDIVNDNQILARGEYAPLMQIREKGEFHKPASFSPGTQVGEYLIDFMQSDFQATIKVKENQGYIRFDLKEIKNSEDVELVIWGPYPSNIDQIIGETVGVVRDSSFAFGIQAMNIKTLGGFPYEESDIDKAYDIFETNDLVDVSDSLKVLYRGHTAEKKEFGSVLQAYCRDRSEERIISNWNHDFFVAPAFNDGGVLGSSIALFGCPADQTLKIIGEIELSENLPHPILDGEWGKTARKATSSYLIMNYGVESLDDAIKLTKQAGLNYLYHGGPFKNWGHFDLNENEFPNNWESLRICVEKAKKEGVKLGVHTLSNFITPNDPYVSPIPDSRLAIVGSAELVQDISSTQKDIQISDPKFFNQMKNNTLHAVRIGNEILRYEKVSDNAPWTLLECERGAFGTSASSHMAKTMADKLIDHPYKTFLSNIELSEEIALNIADLFNQTGLRQISFDGLEGNWSTGMGQYGRQLFTQKWYDRLSPENQGEIITDASNPGHFFWHIYTRMNWGEPWYAGFRESQTQYRLLNQSYYRRNLMPSMLGWFRMTPEISIEDIEWLLARAAGFDAGFALVTSPGIVESHGMGREVMALINVWESARMAGVFTDDIKKDLENINKEFHLEEAGPGGWNLFYTDMVKGDYKNVAKQPGEPRIINLELDNPNPEQPVQFVFSNGNESEVKNITLDIDGFKKVLIPINIPPEHHIRYTGGSYLSLYDKNWHLVDKARLVQNQLVLSQGDHKIQFEASFTTDSEEASVHLEFRTLGLPINLRANK